MKFYHVNKDYLDYLQKIDPRVMNKDGVNYKYTKFVLGVIISIGDYKYYAPVSHIKEEMLEKDNLLALSREYQDIVYPIITKDKDTITNKSFYKISAFLRIDFMFPVPDKQLEYLIINRLPQRRKDFVQEEYNYCKKYSEEITDFAQRIYDQALDKINNMHKKCCNFNALEKAHNSWIANDKPKPRM